MMRGDALHRRAFLGTALAFGMAGGLYAEQPPGLSVPPPRKPPPRPSDLIAAAGLGADVGYAVVDSTGRMLEGRGADHPVAPASTLKALTALYALDRLGPEARFATRVLRFGDDLVLAGGGDPVLDTDALATLADLTAAAWGPRSPARFLVFGGALPAIREIAPEQEPHLAYNPAVSGMMLNFNRVHLSWKAGGEGLALQARAARNSPVAYTVRAEAVGQGPLFGWRAENGREIWSVNRAGLRSAGSRWLPVRRPEAYAGDVFQTLCRARGLVLPTPGTGPANLVGGTEIARVESPALRVILRDMMDYSTNLTAEVVGLHASGETDLRASARAMQDWAQARGITGLDLRDHSGLSPESRVTARAMAGIIATSGGHEGLRTLMKPIGLRDAQGRAADGPLRMQAKTGTLNFVSNLAGYGSLPDHGEVIFAIFISDMARRAATEGQELPAGVVTWTQRAKFLQQQLVETWLRRYA
ncbi:MAG: D-alanyl-D-alanine carboxypeptidase [Paracoccus sp. (in: a-proteobacteria)]|nr:D-alanyl-D-alanine carboxypeptidase [Paracoccus sp. (in: a-proteobacteria)]